MFCNSLGHSVPLINGTQQSPGSKYRGSIRVEGLNKAGVKSVIVEMAGAYPKGTVDRLKRTFSLDSNAHRLNLTDAYTFARRPKALEEAFITFEKVTVARGGRSVLIGPKGKGIRLSAEENGRFRVTALTEGSKEGRTSETIQRITFIPRVLDREMTLSFFIE